MNSAAKESEFNASQSRHPSPTRKGNQAPRSKGLKVLIADDDEDNRFVLSRFLGDAGHELIFVTNGQEAIEKFKTESFDVVLMDIKMPVKDGVTATREIREFESLNSQKRANIIALTAHSEKQQVDMCDKTGFSSCLTKPVGKADLLSLIENDEPLTKES